MQHPIIKAAKAADRISYIPDYIEHAPRGHKKRYIEMARRLWHNLRAEDPLGVPLEQRFRRHLIEIAEQAIEERGLDTPAGWDQFAHELTDYRPRPAPRWIVHGEGWYEYRGRGGRWHQAASYLVGREDGQVWAVRVPSRIITVAEAERWLMPAAVREAVDKGLPVKRQGDMYFRPICGADDHDMFALLGTRHEARPRKGGGLTIVHPEHRPVVLSGRYRWRAYQQTQLAARGRIAGD